MASKTFATARIGIPQKIQTYDGQAGGNSGIIYSAPCTLLRIRALSVAASGTLYLMLFDATAVPANTAVPLIAPLPIAGGATADLSLNEIAGDGLIGLQLSSGLVWAASSTAATLTIDSTSSLWPTCRYYA
jgi:hypothetical protein